MQKRREQAPGTSKPFWFWIQQKGIDVSELLKWNIRDWWHWVQIPGSVPDLLDISELVFPLLSQLHKELAAASCLIGLCSLLKIAETLRHSEV